MPQVIIALLYFIGFWGLTFFPALFIPLSSLSLLITFLLLCWNEPSWIKVALFLVVAVLGFAVEWYGVHTGSPFGFYQYGEGLGIKWKDIPLVIGLNWVMMVWGSISLLKWTWNIQNRWVLSFGGGLLMTLTDLLIEQVAPNMEYWMFEMNHVPWNNYAAWLWLGILFSWLLSFIPIKNSSLGAWVFIVNWFFFVALNIV